ncbi:MAG: hypothetical protein ACI8SR_000501 [Oceanicoccus sp.]|jgi:hypothetical protein
MKIIISFILMACLFGCHHNTQPQVNAGTTANPPMEHLQANPETLMADFAHRY